MSSVLFSPFVCGSLSLRNRIVMAPMTRSMSPNQTPGENVAVYYERRAQGGVGLIISEGAAVNRAGALNDVNVPILHSPAALAGWRRVVDAVHRHGAKFMPQLWHQGMVRKPGTGPYPEAPSDGPSGLSSKGKLVGEPMTDADIADTISAFATSAANARAVGCDGIEVHGAHGYLVDQFFWAQSNRRTDAYGGSLASRSQFAAEIVRAIRAATAPDFPIFFRFSQWKQQDYTARLALTPAELEVFLRPLLDAGVDVFDCSTRRFWEPEFDGSPLNLAGWVKRISGRATMTVGSVGLSGPDFTQTFSGDGAARGDLTQLVRRLDDGEFDLVGVGRALISDPDWVSKVRAGRYDELAPFDPAALRELI